VLSDICWNDKGFAAVLQTSGAGFSRSQERRCPRAGAGDEGAEDGQ
jgi:hypothetical protein